MVRQVAGGDHVHPGIGEPPDHRVRNDSHHAELEVPLMTARPAGESTETLDKPFVHPIGQEPSGEVQDESVGRSVQDLPHAAPVDALEVVAVDAV